MTKFAQEWLMGDIAVVPRRWITAQCQVTDMYKMSMTQ